MQRHGYDLSLTHDRSGWRATFLHRSHVLYPWVGQVLHWWPTPWRAVQEAAWRALHTPFAPDSSRGNVPPRAGVPPASPSNESTMEPLGGQLSFAMGGAGVPGTTANTSVTV